MKKISITLICLVLGILGGCSSVSLEGTNISKDASIKKVVTSNANNKKDKEIFKNIEYDSQSFCLKLIDWSTNKIIKKVNFKDNELVFKTFKVDNGYAVISFTAEESIEKYTTPEGHKNIRVPKEFIRKTFKIYDYDLNLLKEIDLEEMFPQEMLSDVLLTLDISSDGNEVVLASDEKLYIYNIKLNQLKKIFENSNPKSIYFTQVKFTKDGERIVYTGVDPKDREENKETSISYGIIELKDGSINNFREKDYKDARKINISGTYVCITDSADGWTKTSSGKVLILNLLEKKGFSINVDGLESTFADVSEDGKYIITANENMDEGILIRQYQISSGKIIKEEKYTPENNNFILEYISKGEEPYKYYFFISRDGHKECFEFVCEEE